MSDVERIRRAYQLTLRPDSLDQYVYWHDNIWPELTDKLNECGIASVTLIANPPIIFLYSEIMNESAWDEIWESDLHKRWAAEVMEPLMHYDEHGVVDAIPLPEIWNFQSK